MRQYHGIVIARHGFVGPFRQFYTSEQEESYRSEVSAGMLRILDEQHPIVDSVWLDAPVDNGNAWSISNDMISRIPEESLRGFLQSRGEAGNDGV